MGVNQEDYMTTDQLVHVISAKLDEQDKKLDRIEKKIDATIDAHNRLADYIVSAKNEILEKLDIIIANTTKKSATRKKKDE